MITAENICKSYRGKPVLQNLGLEVKPGLTILLGENGAGKTTLLRILAGLTRPDTGAVSINGVDLRSSPLQARQNTGFFSHQTMLYNDLSPRENLLFQTRLYGIQNPGANIQTLLTRADLSSRQNDPVRTLSHGMQQRLSLLRSILHDPCILLLDEPTRGLDRKALTFLNEILQESSERKKTILLATHQPGSIECPASRILQLEYGKLQQGQDGAAGRKETARG